MSFFKVPSFLSRSQSMDPHDPNIHGNHPRPAPIQEQDDDDTDFFGLESRTDDQSYVTEQRSEQDPRYGQQLYQQPQSDFPFPMRQPDSYPEQQYPPEQQYYQEQQYQDQAQFQYPQPDLYFNQGQGQGQGPPPPPQEYYDYDPPSPLSMPDLSARRQYPPAFPPGPDPRSDPIRLIMAEGYSFDEAQRVHRYRSRNTHTLSSISVGNLDIQSVGWSESYREPARRPLQRPAPPLPLAPNNSFCDQGMYFPEPAFRPPPPDDNFDLAVRRSIDDENRRKARMTEQEIREREEIERANERAVQIAVQKSFEQLEEERNSRINADPWMIQQLNEKALRDAMHKSMYDIRSPPPYDARLYQLPTAGPVVKRIIRHTQSSDMSAPDIHPISISKSPQRYQPQAAPQFHAHQHSEYHQVAYRPHPLPEPAKAPAPAPSTPGDSRPGSYSVNYNGSARHESASNKEQSIAPLAAAVSALNVSSGSSVGSGNGSVVSASTLASASIVAASLASSTTGSESVSSYHDFAPVAEPRARVVQYTRPAVVAHA